MALFILLLKEFLINIFFLIFIFIINNVNCQSFICKSSDSSGLKIGDSAVLCVHVLESGTRIAIPIEVDEYSVASIKGIYGKISSETNTNFLAQVGTVTSVFPSVRIFYN